MDCQSKLKTNQSERMKKLNERREEEKNKDLSRSAQRHPPPLTHDLTLVTHVSSPPPPPQPVLSASQQSASPSQAITELRETTRMDTHFPLLKNKIPHPCEDEEKFILSQLQLEKCGRGGRGAGADPLLDGRGLRLWEGTDVVRAGTEEEDDDEELDEEIETDGGVGFTPTGDEVLAGVGELRGTERRALTAKRKCWSNQKIAILVFIFVYGVCLKLSMKGVCHLLSYS
ncbi:hypothetical protein E2C01_030531 [Portunus trituberculatus]|uniref:Uncharacterized protein n=1 Tax=Portunus trituberculatus TaxID=210409 RepID=A0A5B7EVH6_PORTR|nr:hypothetical protein [Portunus trituberculatus]